MVVLNVKPLHPTFAAEVVGTDFSQLNADLVSQIHKIVDQYGVVVFRQTGLDDETHLELARHFGQLSTPEIPEGAQRRMKHRELYDISNINPLTGEVYENNKSNEHFHADGQNDGAVGHSLLLAHVLPPKSMGGATEFADTRSIYDDLSSELKTRVNGAIVRRNSKMTAYLGRPDIYGDKCPSDLGRADIHERSVTEDDIKYPLVQEHKGSGRVNLNVGHGIAGIDGMPQTEANALLDQLEAKVLEDKYRFTIEWENPGDLVIWDNASVLHRATGGAYENKYVRDMRRANTTGKVDVDA